MIINKSQGQILKNNWIISIQASFFLSHGQFYVTLSQVMSHLGLKILIKNKNAIFDNHMKNIIYKEICLDLPTNIFRLCINMLSIIDYH